jgi:hypothetical protein
MPIEISDIPDCAPRQARMPVAHVVREATACFGHDFERARHGLEMEPRIPELLVSKPLDKLLREQNVVADIIEDEVDRPRGA